MAGKPPRPSLRTVERGFEFTRLETQCIAAAYALAVPMIRRPCGGVVDRFGPSFPAVSSRAAPRIAGGSRR